MWRPQAGLLTAQKILRPIGGSRWQPHALSLHQSLPHLPITTSLASPPNRAAWSKPELLSRFGFLSSLLKHISACISICAEKDDQTGTARPRELSSLICWPKGSPRPPRLQASTPPLPLPPKRCLHPMDSFQVPLQDLLGGLITLLLGNLGQGATWPESPGSGDANPAQF